MQSFLGLGRAKPIIVRVMIITAAALAIPTAMFATPLPASAASDINDVSIRESFGGRFCIGSDTTDLFAKVVERDCPGRKWNLHSQGTTYLGKDVYKLRLHADTTKCIAAANNDLDVVIHPCDGLGVDWAAFTDSSTGHVRFINRKATQDDAGGSVQYLSGRNSKGSQFVLRPLGSNGFLQQFDLA